MAEATPWAVLLCKFSDDLSEPFDREHFERLFTQDGAGSRNITDFFAEMSHGAVNLSASRVFGWLELQQRRADYKGSGANPAGRDQLIQWARRAAADAGIDLSPYFNVVVYTNTVSDLFGGANGVVTSGTELRPSILGQELGHGYGLDHSRRQFSDDEYGDSWDVMSTPSAHMAEHAERGLIGPGLNAANMAGRKWLDLTRVWSAAPHDDVDAVVELRPLHRRDLSGTLAARVGDFWIEFRTREGWDAGIPRPCVLVHRFEGNRSYLMRNAAREFDLVPGVFFEAGRPGIRPHLRIHVRSIDATGLVATIEISSRPARRVWHTIRYSTSWQPFGDVIGANEIDPGEFTALAVSGVQGQLHLCGQTRDDRLWHTIRYATSWQPFGDIKRANDIDPGRLVSFDCSHVGGELHLCCVADDGTLWHTIRHAVSWQPFGNVNNANDVNPGRFNQVACASVRGELHVIGQTTDGRLWHTIRHTAGWQPFGDVKNANEVNPGAIVAFDCAEVGGQLHLCCVTTDGGLWHTIRYATRWQPFGDVKNANDVDPGAFTDIACDGVGGELQLCGTTSDGKLWHTIRYATSWQPFGDVRNANEIDAGRFAALDCAGVNGELHLCGANG